MFFQILSIFLMATISKANISPTEEYPHRANLDADGKMILYWNFTETDITFEVSKPMLLICINLNKLFATCNRKRIGNQGFNLAEKAKFNKTVLKTLKRNAFFLIYCIFACIFEILI